MRRNYFSRLVVVAVASCVLVLAAGLASAGPVTIQTVPVGNVGNAADTTGFGSVSYAYNIGTYDVTATQYTAFLNAVAKTDTYGLYTPSMATDTTYGCGIAQSGSSGNYTYSTTKNGNFPVNYVTWGDASRFCNWLGNGQPSGAEGNGTTETGSYTLNGATSNAALMAITRNPGAIWCIPTENEWYKAAYYDPTLNSGTGGYWLYPTKSNSQPSNVLSAIGTNNANYYNGGYTDPTNYLTAVGVFAASPSAYGTFDQGGDVWQWNEANYNGSSRGLRGGSFFFNGYYLQSGGYNYDTPTGDDGTIGFRVSRVPEPGSLAVLALGMMGLLVRRRGVGR